MGSFFGCLVGFGWEKNEKKEEHRYPHFGVNHSKWGRPKWWHPMKNFEQEWMSQVRNAKVGDRSFFKNAVHRVEKKGC